LPTELEARRGRCAREGAHPAGLWGALTLGIEVRIWP
jgi:hypothetical protein